MGKAQSKEPEFMERQTAAANARKALLERFRAKAADPATAALKEQRAAERLAKEAADRELARQAAAKADRDARYARRKEKARKKARA